MKDVYMVKYQISDKGIDYPEKEEEIVVPKNETVFTSLKKQLNKYRYAMDLTTKFTFRIIGQYHYGWSK